MTRAAEPDTLTAEVAGGAFEADAVIHIVPIILAPGTDAVDQAQRPFRFRAHADGEGLAAGICPLPSETPSRCERTLPLPAPHIDGAATLYRALLVPPIPASRPYDLPPLNSAI